MFGIPRELIDVITIPGFRAIASGKLGEVVRPAKPTIISEIYARRKQSIRVNSHHA
jgi:hypothetical protein